MYSRIYALDRSLFRALQRRVLSVDLNIFFGLIPAFLHTPQTGPKPLYSERHPEQIINMLPYAMLLTPIFCRGEGEHKPPGRPRFWGWGGVFPFYSPSVHYIYLFNPLIPFA